MVDVLFYGLLNFRCIVEVIMLLVSLFSCCKVLLLIFFLYGLNIYLFVIYLYYVF